MSTPKKVARRQKRSSKARLDQMVEEAIVDCYNESEQATGLYTMIENSLALPFETTVLGVPVTVERVDLMQHRERALPNSAAEQTAGARSLARRLLTAGARRQ